MARLRFGLVGCGLRGVFDPRSVAKTIMALPEAELVAVADTDAERARAAAEHLGLGTNHGDYPSLLRRDDVEAVYVVTPNPVHAENAVAALEAGKPTLLVKPMGMTLADCDRVIRAAARAGRTLMIDSQLPFSPVAVKARALIRQGAIGTPVTTWTIEGRGRYRLGLAEWRFTESGGIFFETLIHTLLLQRWLLGRPAATSVSAWGEKTRFQEYAYPDVVWARVEYVGGLSALLGENHLMDRGFQSRVVVGTEDSLFFERGRLLLGGKSRPPRPPPRAGAEAGSSLSQSIGHFIECVQQGRTPELTGEDGRAATEVALAANRSMETGEPVRLPLAADQQAGERP
jgi:UDP-N-acetyl-2-amino-2-deoxyglucuronate dehydrogenase